MANCPLALIDFQKVDKDRLFYRVTPNHSAKTLTVRVYAYVSSRWRCINKYKFGATRDELYLSNEWTQQDISDYLNTSL